MEWSLEEALAYYKTQGAPGDQSALTALLREIQQEHGGSIPSGLLSEAAAFYGVRESFLLAIVRRIPSLRLSNVHTLELCGGPNCSKRAKLAAFVEQTCGRQPSAFVLKYTGCMRMCGQGPNLKWDGRVYNHADEALIQKLVEGKI